MTTLDLLQLVRDAEPATLPRLAGMIAEAQAALTLRLAEGRPVADPGGSTRPASGADRFLTPAEAAAVAQVPVKRLYEWARGRPGRLADASGSPRVPSGRGLWPAPLDI